MYHRWVIPKEPKYNFNSPEIQEKVTELLKLLRERQKVMRKIEILLSNNAKIQAS